MDHEWLAGESESGENSAQMCPVKRIREKGPLVESVSQDTVSW